MHIGLIIYGSLDTLSGGYLYDRMLVDHLRREGDIVEVISLPWRNYARHLTDNLDNTLLHRLSHTPFDVLVQDELNHPSLFALNYRLRRRARYPIVSIVHHLRASEPRPAWQNALYRLVERRYLASVDAFVFNSQTTKRVVETLAGTGRPSVVALPAGDRPGATLDDAQISARAQHHGPLRLLFLGNLIPRKGLHNLLDALARLPAGCALLTVIGSPSADPAYAHSIQQQIVRLRLGECVTLTGALSGDALNEHFAQSDVLVIPSAYEGYGIAYLEGMAFGLPAIATTAGAAHEIITHAQDGFLIPPGDADQLAHYLLMLAEDRALLLAMSLIARQRFDRHPIWEQTAASIRAFLSEVSQ
jgi:glycosyltransferase involved in cell wall biosynthesis